MKLTISNDKLEEEKKEVIKKRERSAGTRRTRIRKSASLSRWYTSTLVGSRHSCTVVRGQGHGRHAGWQIEEAEVAPADRHTDHGLPRITPLLSAFGFLNVSLLLCFHNITGCYTCCAAVASRKVKQLDAGRVTILCTGCVHANLCFISFCSLQGFLRFQSLGFTSASVLTFSLFLSRYFTASGIVVMFPQSSFYSIFRCLLS